jgi:hypothetical protein
MSWSNLAYTQCHCWMQKNQRGFAWIIARNVITLSSSTCSSNCKDWHSNIYKSYYYFLSWELWAFSLNATLEILVKLLYKHVLSHAQESSWLMVEKQASYQGNTSFRNLKLEKIQYKCKIKEIKIMFYLFQKKLQSWEKEWAITWTNLKIL